MHIRFCWGDFEIEKEPYSGILTDHFQETGNYLVRRPAGMDNWLIVYTLDGGGYFRTPQGETFCRRGEIGLLRNGVPHQYGTISGGHWHFMWAHFAGLPETALLPEGDVIICSIPEGALQRRMLRSFRTLLQDSRDRGRFWQELCENQLSEVLLLVASQLADGLDPRIAQIMRTLSARMKEPLTIAELAADVGLSVSRLSHLFKETTGRSVLDTLNRMRLEQAALLMAHAGRTASEAAVDVGFQSYNHFAALFRKRYEVAPSNYRKGLKHSKGN